MGQHSGKAVIPLGVYTVKAAQLANKVLACLNEGMWAHICKYGAPRMPFEQVFQIGRTVDYSYVFFQANGEAALLRRHGEESAFKDQPRKEPLSIEDCKEIYRNALNVRRILLQSSCILRSDPKFYEKEEFELDCLEKAFNGEELAGREVLFVGHPMDVFEQAMWRPVFEKSWAVCEDTFKCDRNPFKAQVTMTIKKIQGETE